MDQFKFSTSEISKLPPQPGVYKYFNKREEIIYIGKAKNLRKRVASYFNKLSGVNRKTRKLVSEVSQIEIVIVNSEFDALLLENSLIKQYQPRYNILLKDDKSFPYIVITNDRFPKIYATRVMDKNKGEFFGPYTSVKAMNSVLDLIRKLYKIRTCNLALTQENIKQNKFKVCLEFHLGNCLGPCEGKQTEESYLEEISQCRSILKGQILVVKNYYQDKMKVAAEELAFEEAQHFKEKLHSLERFQSKSLIVSQKIEGVDVFTISTDKEAAFINYMRIEHGAINLSETVEIKKKLDETDAELLTYGIINLRQKFESTHKEILTNIPLESWSEDIKIYQPKIGDKKKLTDLSLKNVLFYKKDKISRTPSKNSAQERVLRQLQQDLRLTELPAHIECFDNSNIMGTNPVASMVCFKNAKPSKKDYRHFKIKTVVGPDDFGSMKEIVFRRYHRLLQENKDLPNLVVIDGGKGQLNAAVESLKELDLYGKIPIIGIAKKLEELYFPGDKIPLHLNKKSESLKLIQHIRDEAHRFAITFHRDLRSKGSLVSQLDDIKGLGEVSKEKLLKRFRTLRKMKEASVTELSEEIGLARAKIVKDALNNSPVEK